MDSIVPIESSHNMKDLKPVGYETMQHVVTDMSALGNMQPVQESVHGLTMPPQPELQQLATMPLPQDQVTVTTSDAGPLLIQMMPSSQYQHYIQNQPIPISQCQSEVIASGSFDSHQYFVYNSNTSL